VSDPEGRQVAPLAGHVTSHYDTRGYCHCPCAECSTSLRFCICKECACLATRGGHAGEVDWSAGVPGGDAADLGMSAGQPPCETDSSPTVGGVVAVSAAVTGEDDGRDTVTRGVSHPTSSVEAAIESAKIG